MKGARDFFIFLVIQTIYYALATFNFRAVAAGDMARTLASDAVNCTFGFFTIRKIARDDRSTLAYLGYLLGSVLGTYIGMKLT